MSEILNNNDEVMATQPVLYSSGELVTVANFPEPASANVARTALESAGIPVFMQGENANSLLPVAFEVRLQVRPDDEMAARGVLADFETASELPEDFNKGDATDVLEDAVERGEPGTR